MEHPHALGTPRSIEGGGGNKNNTLQSKDDGKELHPNVQVMVLNNWLIKPHHLTKMCCPLWLWESMWRGFIDIHWDVGRWKSCTSKGKGDVLERSIVGWIPSSESNNTSTPSSVGSSLTMVTLWILTINVPNLFVNMIVGACISKLERPMTLNDPRPKIQIWPSPLLFFYIKIVSEMSLST